MLTEPQRTPIVLADLGTKVPELDFNGMIDPRHLPPTQGGGDGPGVLFDAESGRYVISAPGTGGAILFDAESGRYVTTAPPTSGGTP